MPRSGCTVKKSLMSYPPSRIGRRVVGQEPQAVDAEPLEVVELGPQPAQVADAVVVGVEEAAREHLVEHAPSVPVRTPLGGQRRGADAGQTGPPGAAGRWRCAGGRRTRGTRWGRGGRLGRDTPALSARRSGRARGRARGTTPRPPGRRRCHPPPRRPRPLELRPSARGSSAPSSIRRLAAARASTGPAAKPGRQGQGLVQDLGRGGRRGRRGPWPGPRPPAPGGRCR